MYVVVRGSKLWNLKEGCRINREDGTAARTGTGLLSDYLDDPAAKTP